MRGGIQLRANKETYDISALVTYLNYHALKVVTFQTFLPQLFLLMLVLLVNHALSPASTANAIGYSVDSSTLSDAALESVSTFDEWYAWLGSLHGEMASPSNKSAEFRVPVVGLLVRHFVRSSSRCPSSALSRRLVRLHKPDTLPTHCWGHRPRDNDPDVDPLLPFYNDTVFNSTAWIGHDRSLSSDIHSAFSGAVYSQKANFAYDKWNSLLFLPFNISHPEYSAGWLEELKKGKWLREASIAVSVQSVTYHRDENVFIAHTSLLEVEQGGSLIISTRHQPFRLSVMKSAREIALLVFLCVLCLALFYLIFELLFRIALKREIHQTWIISMEASDWFVLMYIVLLTIALGFRFHSYHVVNDMMPSSQASGLNTVTYLLGAAELQSTIDTLWAWVTFSTLVRVFVFLRYCTRLSLVNETLISGVHDFMGITFVAMLVLVAYALTGHLLWYHTATDFNSFGGSILLLFNVMISLEIRDYDVYLSHNPKSTMVFFVSFFIVSWCVILNVAVGILATSFASALDTQTFIRRPNWSLYSMIRDGKSVFQRLVQPTAFVKGRPQLTPDSTPDEDTEPGSRPLSTESVSPSGRRRRPRYQHSALYRFFSPVTPMSVQRSVEAVYGLRRFQATHNDGTNGTSVVRSITLQQLSDCVHLDVVSARRMGTKSNLHVGLHDAKLREWKVLQKAVAGGHDVTTQLAAQHRQLQQLHELICAFAPVSGGATLEDNEPSFPGDETHNGSRTSMASSVGENPVEVLRLTMADLLTHAEEVLVKTQGSLPRLEALVERLAAFEQVE